MRVPLMGNRLATVMGGSAGFTTKFEQYAISNADGSTNVFTINWMAQVFKANTGHTLNGLKLPLFRTGTTGGEVSISIQALSGGDPDGTDLSLYKFDSQILGTSAPGVFKEYSMPAVALAVGVSYAIVIRQDGGDGSNTINWESDASTPTYSDGQREISGNSGNTWTADTTDDHCFEDWGFI